MSPKPRSAPMPVDTTAEKATSRFSAQSRIAVHKAPDCDTRAIPPSAALLLPKVAFKPTLGRMRPRQFGPRNRIPYERARSTTFRSRARPGPPTSRKPADRMIIALIPCFIIVFYLPFNWSQVAAAAIFAIAALTDWLDGYLARRLQQISKLGQTTLLW